MAADIFINRTGIQAGAAADAIKALSGFCVFQYVGTAVVHQYHIHFFRTVYFVFLARATEDGIVYRYLLTGTISSQQWPEQRQIIDRGQHLFNADQHDMGFGECGTEPCIALVLSHRYASDIGNDKVGAGNAYFGIQVFLPQLFARYHG